MCIFNGTDVLFFFFLLIKPRKEKTESEQFFKIL